MEKLPVEVIRKILSHLGSARDVVLASTTCKHLRKGFCLHRHTLSFNSDEMNAWPIDDELETIITKTIFQTTGLQYLTIFMDDTHEFRFNATSVTAWLKYTRDSLLQLRYNVRTYPNINIIENFNRKKLEVLVLVHNSITSVYPSYLEFPWLKSLSLSHFSVSALDLSFLLTACPKLETLSLVDPEITMSGPQKTMKVSSSSLKSFYVEELRMDKFILEADFLDSLYLKECTFEIFKLTGKGTLRVLRIDHVKVIHLEIGDSTENLEVVDVSYSRTIRPEFYRMILKSANLYKIRLWDVIFDNAVAVVVDLIPHYLPRLTHLSLHYDFLIGGSLFVGLDLYSVDVLEFGWTAISDLFSFWVDGFLYRCHKLRMLVIYGVVTEVNTQEECQILAELTEYMLELGRKYTNVKFVFKFE